MADFLRGLGLGVINLLGVAVPGALLVTLVTGGLLFPALCVALNVAGVAIPVLGTWPAAVGWAVLGAFGSVSYVTGYILRLTSPNALDEASVRRMERKGPQKRGTTPAGGWPSKVGFHRPEDRFPYPGLSGFLKEAGHEDLCDYVVWKPGAVRDPKCDNSRVNRWKTDIKMYCPALAAAVASEEAHVRLMSGTWLAIRTATPPVMAGALLSLAAYLASLWPPSAAGPWPTLRINAWYYLANVVLSAFAIASMQWGRVKIEALFHPRRVGELLFILDAKRYADRLAARESAGVRVTFP